jgi:uncharacterized protein (TIGR02646 family)
MRQLQRLACPAILTSKADDWTRRYLEKRSQNPKLRPDSRQYAHREILDTLAAMSHKKCFYCEHLLDEDEYTVDHYVEVSEAPEKAFAWDNLYLCCRGCQGKLAEATVARADCLDPCDAGIDPAEHLTFEHEVILPRNDSQRGRQTIRKQKLDRGDLQLRRSRRLNRFKDELVAIQRAQIQEGRKELTDDERDRLRRFGAPEAPFSLMFRELLQALG